MKVIMVIDMSRSKSLGEYPPAEVAQILRQMAARIERQPHFSPGHDQPIYDGDGKEVGYLGVTE